MGVIELDGHLVRKLVPVLVGAPETPHVNELPAPAPVALPGPSLAVKDGWPIGLQTVPLSAIPAAIRR